MVPIEARWRWASRIAPHPGGVSQHAPARFNELFGDIEREDLDEINRVIAVEIPAKVAADKSYQDARKNSDRQNARIEHDGALRRVMMELLADRTELFKQLGDDPGYKK